jgi:hypothetical protein
MSLFQPFVFFLCIVTSVICTWLLFRGWRRTGTRLLMWSALCFLGLAANNIIVFIDIVVLPDIDLRPLRLATSLIAVSVMLWALIWETD